MTSFVRGDSTKGLPVGNMRKVRMIERTVNTATSGNNLAAGAHEFLPVPAKTVVLAAGVDVVVASATAGTVALGDGVTPARYKSAAVVTSTGQQALVPGAPFVYAAADTIDVTVAVATINDATLRVWALVADVS